MDGGGSLCFLLWSMIILPLYSRGFFCGGEGNPYANNKDKTTITKPEKVPELKVLFSSALNYYNDGADELIFMDIVASLYNRNSLHDIIWA